MTDPQKYDLRYSSRSFGKGLEIQSFSDPLEKDWKYSSDHNHDPFTRFTTITTSKLEIDIKNISLFAIEKQFEEIHFINLSRFSLKKGNFDAPSSYQWSE